MLNNADGARMVTGSRISLRGVEEHSQEPRPGLRKGRLTADLK